MVASILIILNCVKSLQLLGIVGRSLSCGNIIFRIPDAFQSLRECKVVFHVQGVQDRC